MEAMDKESSPEMKTDLLNFLNSFDWGDLKMNEHSKPQKDQEASTNVEPSIDAEPALEQEPQVGTEASDAQKALPPQEQVLVPQNQPAPSPQWSQPMNNYGRQYSQPIMAKQIYGPPMPQQAVPNKHCYQPGYRHHPALYQPYGQPGYNQHYSYQLQYVPRQFAVPQTPASVLVTNGHMPTMVPQLIPESMIRPIGMSNGEVMCEILMAPSAPHNYATTAVPAMAATPTTAAAPAVPLPRDSKPRKMESKRTESTKTPEMVSGKKAPRKRKHLSNEVPSLVKGPPTALSLFKDEQWFKVKKELNTKDSDIVNAVLVRKWKNLSPAEQDKYQKQAAAATRILAQFHPELCPQKALSVEYVLQDCSQTKPRTKPESDFGIGGPSKKKKKTRDHHSHNEDDDTSSWSPFTTHF